MWNYFNIVIIMQLSFLCNVCFCYSSEWIDNYERFPSARDDDAKNKARSNKQAM